MLPRSLAGLLFLLTLWGCRPEPQSRTRDASRGNLDACGPGATRLRHLAGELPAEPLGDQTEGDLPESTLGIAPSGGRVIAVSESGLRLHGLELQGTSQAARLDALGSELARWQREGGSENTLYVAAPRTTTIMGLREVIGFVPHGIALKLLVRTRLDKEAPGVDATTPAWVRALAARLLAAPDPNERRALAAQGYERATAGCAAVRSLVEELALAPARERWQALRDRLPEAVDRCDCEAVDLVALETVLVADHRSGTATLGALPISFLRDRRCGASMPLRSLAKLVRQIERFDIEFSGRASGDELHFDDVVTNERLLVEFCDALPGETLAALVRGKQTLYWPTSNGGSVACQAWRFHPAATGTANGTWLLVEPSSPSSPPNYLEYSQAAEELHVRVPADSGRDEAGKEQAATAGEAQVCRATYRLVGIDQDSIEFDGGRWYFSREACTRTGGARASAGSCVDAWRGRALPKPP